MLLTVAAANWAVFNVFEFARKTHAPEEEREGVETYSSRHGPRGAVLLTAVNVAVACGALFLALPSRVAAGAAVAAAALPIAGSVPCLLRPTRAAARWFRGCHAAFLVAFYVVAIAALWVEFRS